MKTHRTDGVSLTFSILFFGVVSLWLLTQVLNVALPNAGWLVAGALILFGVLGLVGTLRAGRATPDPEQPAEPDTDRSSDTSERA